MVADDQKIIAIIPARGGSQRIPQKNIRDFKGKPMVAWTIEAALETGCFERVLVSTDDPEVASVSIAAGAECPFLRTDKADHITPVSEATLHALGQAEAHYNEVYDVVVQLMPNCPLRSSGTIRRALDDFLAGGCGAMLSHVRYGWLNPWWACKINDNKSLEPVFKNKLKERSQDLPLLYCPTGAIWIARTQTLKEHGTFHAPEKTAFVMDWQEGVDIDDMDDWRMAELIFDLKNIT